MKKILLCIFFLIPLIIIAQKNSELKNEDVEIGKLKLYKENAHASYFNDKFQGRRTASGTKYDNRKLTAAHKKFAFGTKLKITNIKNNKSVIVKVIDRGPFTRGREIDLSKKAFMTITSSKNRGAINVKIEILED